MKVLVAFVIFSSQMCDTHSGLPQGAGRFRGQSQLFVDGYSSSTVCAEAYNLFLGVISRLREAYSSAANSQELDSRSSRRA